MTKQEYLKYYYEFDAKRKLLSEMYYRDTITLNDVNNYMGSAILDLISLTAPFFSEDNKDKEPLTDAEVKWIDIVVDSARYWVMEDIR